jgi:hypothetical protein
MSETRGVFKKIVGKTYPKAGEIRVRRTNHVELFAIDGTRYPRPQREERLWIYVEKDGVEVGFGVVTLPAAPSLDPDS